MDGISLQMEKTVNLPPATHRTDYFRPHDMKRSITDITPTPKKRHEKSDLETRQTLRGNQVPVVSVQYDVLKTPPSPLMYRFRRLHTPLPGTQTNGRSKSEDRLISAPVCSTLEYPPAVYEHVPEYPLKRSARLDRRLDEMKRRLKEQQDQVVATVENHQLKGLGVGKCYSEYHPPPTAPEQAQQRQGFTPSTSSRASQRPSIILSPMNQCQSASQSRQQPSIPSQRPVTQDRTNLKHSQANTIKQITNIYNARQKSMIRDKDIENKTAYQNGQHHPAYLHSPMLYAQKQHPGNHELKGHGHQIKADGQGHYQNEADEGHQHKGQGHQCSGDGHGDPGYAAYQNVKNDYSGYLNEYNK